MKILREESKQMISLDQFSHLMQKDTELYFSECKLQYRVETVLTNGILTYDGQAKRVMATTNSGSYSIVSVERAIIELDGRILRVKARDTSIEVSLNKESAQFIMEYFGKTV